MQMIKTSFKLVFLSVIHLPLLLSLASCGVTKPLTSPKDPLFVGQIRPGMPAINPHSAIYEVPVNAGLTYQDVLESLKSISEGLNFVNPANFPIGEHMKLRGQEPQGIKAVHSYCNLSMGTEIILDHPEFLVFAPCRIAIYEKLDEHNVLKLYIAMDRPTFDLQSVKSPTERAKKSAQELETKLLEIMDRARKGDF